MAEHSAIQWTNHTWNPWHGCRPVSPGCAHCYMFTEKRQYGQEPTLVVKSKTKFRDPLKWKDPAFVFTCSWSDWFIEEADHGWRDEAWDIIRATPHLTYQILTKRVERVLDHLPSDWPLKNVWLGTSVEDQKNASKRIPNLLALPATVRFISAEPLLGPIDLGPWFTRPSKPVEMSLDRWYGPEGFDPSGSQRVYPLRIARQLDWVIVGGESGPKARPCRIEWIRAIVQQCRAAGVPCFVKQLGAKPSVDHPLVTTTDEVWQSALPRRDGEGRPVPNDKKGGDIEEFPMDLRVREMPEVRAV